MDSESDCTPELAPYYEERLRQLIQRFRSDLGKDELPFIIGQLVDSYKPSSRPDAPKNVINRAHIQIAKDTPNVYYVSSKGLVAPKDYVHFDAESQRELGRRYADVYTRKPEEPELTLFQKDAPPMRSLLFP